MVSIPRRKEQDQQRAQNDASRPRQDGSGLGHRAIKKRGDEFEALAYSRTGALVPDASGGAQPASFGLRRKSFFLPYRTAKNLVGLLRRVLFAVYGYPNDDGSLQNHGFKLRS